MGPCRLPASRNDIVQRCQLQSSPWQNRRSRGAGCQIRREKSCLVGMADPRTKAGRPVAEENHPNHGVSMESFRNRSVLITGAASGIGRARALTLAAEDARIAALDRQAEAL